MGTPKIGNPDRRAELNESFPQEQILGTIDPSLLTGPTPMETTWTREDGTTISLTEPPPPWEVADHGYTASDARRFVEVPPNWALRWINPRLLDSEGWRDWQACLASDNRIQCKVPTMVSPEGYIRRGGSTGDILCWMWKGWYESKIQLHRQRTDELTNSAVNKQEELRDEFRRGTYGPNVKFEGGKHPTHTMAEGRSLTDN